MLFPSVVTSLCVFQSLLLSLFSSLSVRSGSECAAGPGAAPGAEGGFGQWLRGATLGRSCVAVTAVAAVEVVAAPQKRIRGGCVRSQPGSGLPIDTHLPRSALYLQIPKKQGQPCWVGPKLLAECSVLAVAHRSRLQKRV